MVLMATWGCCRRRGHWPRLGLGMALATIGTAAAFGRHDTRPPRHSTDTTLAAIRRHRGGPRMVAADGAGFRAGGESVVPATALIARRKWSPVNLFAPPLAREGGAARLAARARPWC